MQDAQNGKSCLGQDSQLIFIPMAPANAHHTVIIIGAGPIGLACALEAKKWKLDYLVLDKGCLVNSLYHYPANMTFFSTSERLEIGGIPFVSNNPKPTRSEALEYYRRVAFNESLAIHLLPSMSAVPYNKSESMKRNHLIHTSQETLCKFAQSVHLLVRPIASALDHLI